MTRSCKANILYKGPNVGIVKCTVTVTAAPPIFSPTKCPTPAALLAAATPAKLNLLCRPVANATPCVIAASKQLKMTVKKVTGRSVC